MANNEEGKKVIPQRESVHVVFFSCQNCGEETDYIQFCPDCGQPMRVIDVVEKFGEKAEDFIKKIEDRLVQSNTIKDGSSSSTLDDSQEPNIIVLGDDPSDEDIPEEDVGALGEIFPDDEEMRISDGSTDVLSDLDDIVAELDIEDDDFSFDDLGEEGLPEL